MQSIQLAAHAKAVTKAGDSGRRGEDHGITAAQATPHVPEPAHAARRGTRHSEEARRNRSEAQRPRGARPPKVERPWTAEEDELL